MTMINEPPTTEAFDNGVQSFNSGKDILDIPCEYTQDEIEQYKDGYYFALDQDVISNAGLSDGNLLQTSFDDDSEFGTDERVIGQDVLDGLFDDISSFEKEDEQV